MPGPEARGACGAEGAWAIWTRALPASVSLAAATPTAVPLATIAVAPVNAHSRNSVEGPRALTDVPTRGACGKVRRGGSTAWSWRKC
eukprot:scaffold22778_cov36-Tisochrysis_lutea.AAC.1